MNTFKKVYIEGRLPVVVSLDINNELSNLKQHMKIFEDKNIFMKLNPAFVGHNDVTLTNFTSQFPTLFDAKLNDIPNSMKSYKNKYFHDNYKYHAVTLNPYCGYESLKVFTDDKSIFSFIWTLSSDLTANEWQRPIVNKLFESDLFNDTDNVGMVVPSTNLLYLEEVRANFPDTLLLIPGIGHQGGSIADVKTAIGIENVLFVIGRRLINSKNILEELKIIESEING